MVLFPADNVAAPRFWGNLGYKERGDIGLLPQRCRNNFSGENNVIAECDVQSGALLPMWEKDINLRTIPRRNAARPSLRMSYME